jgi:cell division ATPase FtsA
MPTARERRRLAGISPVSQFNELIAPLVKRTLLACRRALKDAGVEAQEVLEVVMVGGSTRVPLVRERVGEFFGRTPLTSIDPDKVVAIGGDPGRYSGGQQTGQRTAAARRYSALWGWKPWAAWWRK